MRKLTALLIFILLAAGCIKKDTGHRLAFKDIPPKQTAYLYISDDGERFTVKFINEGDAAWVFMRNRTVKLPRVISGSGFRYESGGIELKGKGEEAVLKSPEFEKKFTVDRRRSVFEDAKLRGMDFKALGNEPGWVLELGHEQGFLITDYGKKKYLFNMGQYEEYPGEKITVLNVRSGKEEIRITLKHEREGCVDTMEGDEFQTSVEIEIEDKTLRGCGTALH